MTIGTTELAVVGVSHLTAPIQVRERFATAGVDAERWTRPLLAGRAFSECVVISTCNRIECYAVAPDPPRAIETLSRALCDRAGVEEGERYLFAHTGIEAARHLFRVTAGLESLVLGEPQIQGQVRSAYQDTPEELLGPVLHRLFQSALAAGGRVRAATRVSEGAASIPSAAVDLARKVFGSLAGKSVLVLGTGEMGQTTVRCLRSEGVERVFVASRSPARAERVARLIDGFPLTRDEARDRLGDVELVIAATDAEAGLLSLEDVRVTRRSGPATVILDIALPRNVEPEVADLPGIFLYNIDDLQRVVEQTVERRSAEFERADAIVRRHADKFWTWTQARAANPAVQALRSAAHGLLEQAIDRARPGGPRDEDADREVRLAARALLNKILHGPTEAIRLLAAEPSGAEDLAALVAALDALVERPPGARIRNEGMG